VTQFPHLMSPLRIGAVTVRNRIVSTGHDTGMADHGGVIGDQLIAYQEARARGGAGLIVLQVAAISPEACYTSHILQAMNDDCIPGYARMTDAVTAHGATIFGQVFHPGREVIGSADGTLGVTWSSSTVPNERYHVKPRAMTPEIIRQTHISYADAADRMPLKLRVVVAEVDADPVERRVKGDVPDGLKVCIAGACSLWAERDGAGMGLLCIGG